MEGGDVQCKTKGMAKQAVGKSLTYRGWFACFLCCAVFFMSFASNIPFYVHFTPPKPAVGKSLTYRGWFACFLCCVVPFLPLAGHMCRVFFYGGVALPGVVGECLGLPATLFSFRSCMCSFGGRCVQVGALMCPHSCFQWFLGILLTGCSSL